jgi:hypothetical protein
VKVLGLLKGGMSLVEVGLCDGEKWIQHSQYSTELCILSTRGFSLRVASLEPHTNWFKDLLYWEHDVTVRIQEITHVPNTLGNNKA